MNLSRPPEAPHRLQAAPIPDAERGAPATDTDVAPAIVPLAWVVPAWAAGSALLLGFVWLACRARGIAPSSPAALAAMATGVVGCLLALQALMVHAVARPLGRLAAGHAARAASGWELLPHDGTGAPALLVEVQQAQLEWQRLQGAAATASTTGRHALDEKEALLGGLPQALFQLASDGTILRCNAAASLLCGEPADALVGSRLSARLAWPQHDELARLLRELVDATGCVSSRLNDGQALMLRAAGGANIAVQASFAQIRVNQELRMMVALSDVTELEQLRRDADSQRVALAAQLEDTRAELSRERGLADAAARSKSDFLSNMSHELRTPMNAIINLAQVARRDAAPAQVATLQRVVEAAQQLMSLLNDILQLARLEAGVDASAPQDIDVQSCAMQVARMLGAPAAAKGLELVPWFDATVPATMRLDEAGFRQVLMNLLGNALKFTERGHVTLRLRLLRDAAPGPVLRVEVSDTGIGMPATMLQRLGEPFEQAEPSSTRSVGGTGLGLAITQRVLQRMGALLQVRSQPDRGSTFWFDLPVAGGCVPARWPSPGAGSPLRVLVINDLGDARAATTAHLDALGCRAQAVGSSTEALLAVSHAEADGDPFDACLLDAQMGDSIVLELTRRIRSLARGQPPMMIALAAPEPGDTGTPVWGRQVAALVAKPCGPLELAHALRQARDERARVRDTDVAAADSAAGAATDWQVAETGAEAIDPLAAHWRSSRLLRADLGMRFVRGDAEAFGRLLARFAQSHRDDPARLRQMAGAGDWAAAHVLAHALKSTAGAIGALEVAALAAAVPPPDGIAPAGHDAAAQRSTGLADALESLVGDIGRLLASASVAALRSRPEAEPIPVGGNPGTTEAAPGLPVLQGLLRALKRRDMAGLRYARQHEDDIRRELGRRAAPVLQAVGAFDYDKALLLLRSGADAPPGQPAGPVQDVA